QNRSERGRQCPCGIRIETLGITEYAEVRESLQQCGGSFFMESGEEICFLVVFVEKWGEVV
ncbi:MAG: hypothetical protein U0N94_08600, partial [Clostridia bacterium]